jgi:hypothetical protein
MSYHHVVGSVAVRPAHPNISIFESLGIAGQTSWDLLTSSQVPKAVETLTGAIQAFMDQVNGLLFGLTPDLPEENL